MLELFALSSTIVLTQGLTLGPTGRGGRIPFPTDSVTATMAHQGIPTPTEGQALGNQKWTAVTANGDGWFENLRGYTAFSVQETSDRVAILAANGHGMVYVNSEPHMGDPYGYGYLEVPVALKSGTNTLIFGNGRGRLHAELRDPKGKAQFGGGDITMPDFVVGKGDRLLMAMPVMNTTNAVLSGLTLVTKVGTREQITKLPTMLPASVRKLGFELPPYNAAAPGKVTLDVSLRNGTVTLDQKTFELEAKNPNERRNVTFRSEIDGSVQYYAVLPPQEPKPNLGIVLTVHGASVEASGQAAAYSAKPDFWIVAATNRRPYGFDWEDWGRMDALEVLDHATKTLQADPEKTYLTGHSMGGHGTWIIGATFPGKFGAIAPSAGWRSFFTYGGKPRESQGWQEPFARSTNGSDLDLLMDNFMAPSIYVLHGDADDNVPVTEARAMKESLAKMGKTIGYHEESKAGHWWDGDRSPGADCVDWPAIFEMFRTQPLDPWVNTKLTFVTVNPVVSSGMEGFDILLQGKRMAPSRFEVQRSSEGFRVTTENVTRIRVPGRTQSIDGQAIASSGGSFELRRGAWIPATGNATEFGPLKEAMRNRFTLVYGTSGTAEENAWSLAKARFDAEQWLYRGNGDTNVISDAQFVKTGTPGTVVIYGNSETNLAWAKAVGNDNRFKATREQVTVAGAKSQPGSMGYLVALPRGRSVILIGGTTIQGMKACDRLPLFVSGVGYPDWTVFRDDVAGTGYDGVMSTGYWGAGQRPIERFDR